MTEKTFLQIIKETLDKELSENPKIFLIGEDIGFYGGAFGVTKGLFEKYGPKRVVDTPMSEQTIVGLAVGSSMNGLRPIAEIMFMDFITLAYDQLFNHASIFSYASNGSVKVPMVLRVPAGAGRGYGATHSKTLIAPLMNIPGIKIVVPSDPNDVKGLLRSSIKDDNPVIFVENKLLYSMKTEKETLEEYIPLGKAKIAKEGKDILIITFGKSVFDSLDVANNLEKEGYSIEVMDLRTLKPLDKETIIDRVNKIKKVVVVEEGYSVCGVASEIMALISENCFFSLDAPLKRVCMLDVPIPCAQSLENSILPNINRIDAAVRELLNG